MLILQRKDEGVLMFLGIDCGTQGTKALIIDEAGTPFGRGYARHALIERSNGAREQEPHWWVDALRKSVTDALANSVNKQVRALGVSGQQHGLVVLDDAMQVIRPAKLWNDTETAPQNEELVAHFGGKEAFFERFGIVPLTGYTVSKLLWLRQREPENFARVKHVMLPHEYLNFWLTGRVCAEYGDASGTAYFDVRSRQWSREILDYIDGGSGQLFDALPKLIGANESVGAIRADVAAELGLPTDCLVAAGGGDNMMGAIGTGNVREGIVTLSLGTSATVYSFHNEPILDPTGNVAPFCSSSGGWLPLVCTMNATNVVTQTLEMLSKGVGDIDPALALTAPGADGLVFVPFLNGERTPDLPGASGNLSGVSANNFTPQNLIRAAVEGVSFGILNGLDLVQAGHAVDRIFITGGGAKSGGWRQLIADATGAQVDVPLEEEAGCLGAAMQAIFAWSAGQGNPQTFVDIAERCVRVDSSRSVHPDASRQTRYAEARENYRRTLMSLYGV
jgi:xylulokinase